MIAQADGRIRHCNEVFQRITGYSRQELTGMDWRALFPAGVNTSQSCRPTSQPLHGLRDELRLRRKSGCEVIVQWQHQVIEGPSGEPLYEVGQLIDLTRYKMTEMTLQHYAMVLDRSNKDLQDFAYVASHDLQEPLRMVRSYLELLARRYKGRLDDDADDFIAYAIDGATRMQKLISGLLAYSRLGTEAGVIQQVSSEAAFQNALLNLKIAVEESGARVTHDPLPVVPADELQLTRLFQNLVSNALKFRSEQTPRVHVTAKELNGEWQFSVSDNGIGLDPKFATRIFQIFQRLHTHGRYEGAGIGLAVCKRIVDRHGGRIWVESAPGQGATFYFTLPCQAGRFHGM